MINAKNDKCLIGMMTVRENIMFSAKLRLPSDVYGKADRERIVNEVLGELNLEKCKDTLIGNELVRGVSGGERKRASIGCELVMRPRVLFLDEPTSGLDAATAVQVVQTVRSLAMKGCTVAMSIHQPRFSIFKLLDHVILLSDGVIIYQGPTMGVIDHFASVGFVCEANNNPADFMFDALSGIVPQQHYHLPTSTHHHRRPSDDFSALEDASPDGFVSLDAKAAHSAVLRAYENSDYYKNLNARIDDVIAHASAATPTSFKKSDVQGKAKFGASTFNQFIIICERYALGVKRMPVILIAQMVVMILFAGIVGGIYWQVDESFQGLQNRVGAIFFMIMSMIFSNLGAIELLIKERALFLHQKSAGYYSTGPYFLASVLCDLIPLRIVPMFIFGAVAYPCLGFQRSWEAFWWFQLTMISTAIASGAICYLVSSLVGVFAIANLIVTVIYVIQMLFGGLLVNLDTLPVFLHFIQYLSLFKQGYSALAINELHGLKFEIAPFIHITGDQYLEQQGFGLGDRPKNVGLLLGSALVYLILGYLALTRLKKE
jgi:ATP-binding cassette subfamily G (WHITE) protein 2